MYKQQHNKDHTCASMSQTGYGPVIPATEQSKIAYILYCMVSEISLEILMYK